MNPSATSNNNNNNRDIKDDLLNRVNNSEQEQEQEQEQQPTANPIQFCFDTILKEARQEDTLVKQLFYTMLSAYTNNPINLAVNSPSGEGKNYVINKVADNFPKTDVMFLAGMTDKALFHRQGRLVIKNTESGEYEDIEPQIAEIDSEIKSKKSELKKSKDESLKESRNRQIEELEQQKQDLYKDAKKLIDLSHKILIFLDTPRPELFNALMPLLSHDKYEIEYEYVDTHNGIKTKSNILRGWPAVIFAQAIDYSHYQRYDEIKRRFIISNPKMTTEKYADAIDLTFAKFGLPHFAYQQKVVKDNDKQRVRNIIIEIRNRISDICNKSEPGENNVFIPYREALVPQLRKEKAFDMTSANRFGTFITLLSLVNIDKRPKIVLEFKRESKSKSKNEIESKSISGQNPLCPLALFEDVKEAMFLMEYSGADGVRPYVLEWYHNVFLPAYNEQRGPRTKITITKKGEQITAEENTVAVTTDDLVQKTKEVYKRVYTKNQIRDSFLYPLMNAMYIDSTESELNKKAHIYYPLIVIEQSSANERMHEKNKSCILFQQTKVYVENPSMYPDKQYIKSQIQALMQCTIQIPLLQKTKIIDHQGIEIDTIDELVDRYYHNPDDYFNLSQSGDSDSGNDNDNDTDNDNDSDNSNSSISDSDSDSIDTEQNSFQKSDIKIVHRENPEITSETQQNQDNDTDFTTQSEEIKEKMHDDQNIVHSFIFSCYYCDYGTNNENQYQRHVVNVHDKPAYPSLADIDKLGLRPQGKDWEK